MDQGRVTTRQQQSRLQLTSLHDFCLFSWEKIRQLCLAGYPSHVGIRSDGRWILFSEFKYYILEYIRNVRQTSWNEATSSKLRDLTPILGEWCGARRNIRRGEFSLWIGHTRFLRINIFCRVASTLMCFLLLPFDNETHHGWVYSFSH